MFFEPQLLLVGAIAAVGVLHTIVPDHWVPITLIARQQGWTRAQTASASLKAGTGHILSTLLIALIVWAAGVLFAEQFGRYIDIVSILALIGFGGGIAISSLLEMWGRTLGASYGGGATLHGGPERGDRARVPTRTALLLILGSSPMVEGIPTFFAAGKYGVGLIVVMSFVFGLATIATYVALCVCSTAGLKRISLGPLEHYGEVLSGACIALMGVVLLV
ncbi:MAG TPA: hypothetical protein VGG10_18075 [Rhizomicrobium sp.]